MRFFKKKQLYDDKPQTTHTYTIYVYIHNITISSDKFSTSIFQKVMGQNS